MKKIVLLNLLILGFISFSLSNPIDVIKAKKIAKNFYWERVNSINKTNFDAISLKHIYTQKENDVDIYYVFDVNDDNGFVIVTADNDVYPILGYSFEGHYMVSNEPNGYTYWMDGYKEEILYAKANNIKADAGIANEWARLDNLNETKNLKSTTKAGPLCTTLWNQNPPYNNLCPADANSPYGGHCPVGCVALAMARVMKYHNQPTQGTGSKTYTSSYGGYTYGPLTANFATTTYDWANMANSVTTSSPSAQITAVSTLCYHVAVSLGTFFMPTMSGAYNDEPVTAFKTYWRYKTTVKQVLKSAYSTSAWETLIKNEIDNNRPLMYSGQSTSGGHSFVCDGYQSSQFHMLWGLPGANDGYFSLTSLNPGGGYPSFTSTQAAIIEIQPISGTSINDISTNVNVELYPNPATDKLFVEFNGTEPIQVRLINTLGEVVLTEAIENTASVNVSNLPSGLYFAEITSAENQKTIKKVIIE